jgi:hypothetical protein
LKKLRPVTKEAVTFFMSTLRIKKRRRTYIGPILLIIAGLLLIVLMIWQLSLSKTTIPSVSAPIAPAEITRVDLNEARLAFESGEAIFIDVRNATFYNNEHIPGSVNIPLEEIETQLSSLNSDQWYIPYCT